MKERSAGAVPPAGRGRGQRPRHVARGGPLPRGRRGRLDRGHRGRRDRPRAGCGADRFVASPLNVGHGHGHDVARRRSPCRRRPRAQLVAGVPVYGAGEGELLTPTGALLVTAHATGYGPLPAAAARRRRPRRGHARHAGPAQRPAPDRRRGGRRRRRASACWCSRPRWTTCRRSSSGRSWTGCWPRARSTRSTRPVQMKKGRPGVLVTVIARARARARPSRSCCSRETTTLGVRRQEWERTVLERETVDGGDAVRRRSRSRSGGAAGRVYNAQPEFEDCQRARGASRGVPVKEVWAAALAAWRTRGSASDDDQAHALPHDADLLRQRRAARGPRLHHDRRRRADARAAAARATTPSSSPAPTSTARTSSASPARRACTTQQHCDQIAARFRAALGALDIRYDRFIRTTDEIHKRGVLALWEQLRGGADARRAATPSTAATYAGWYCPRCEAFKDEDELKQPGNLCPDHERPCEWTEEENFFFRLSAYSGWLRGARSSAEPPAHRARGAAQRGAGRDPAGAQGLQRQPRAREVGDPGAGASPTTSSTSGWTRSRTTSPPSASRTTPRTTQVLGRRRRADAPHRQGDHPLPLPLLAGHAARGRRARAHARVRPGLHHARTARSSARRRATSSTPRRSSTQLRARRRPLLPAARGRLRPGLGLHRRRRS